MIDLLIFSGFVAVLIAWHWNSVFWGREDWKRLRLPDDYDPAKSRGKIVKGWLR